MVKESCEDEFEALVTFIVDVDKNIKKMFTAKDAKLFDNVKFDTIVIAILRLLDARVLDKDLQIVGIKMIRKIIEVENHNEKTPASEWENYD